VTQRLAGVDPVPRAEKLWVHRDVRGRVAERSAPLVAGDDGAVELEGPAEHRRGTYEIGIADRVAHGAGRDPLDLCHWQELEPGCVERVERARSTVPEPEVRTHGDRLRPDRREVRRDELLG
jgi:hypothetical protein